MASHHFELPAFLQSLLGEGRWPRTAREAMLQNLHPLVAPERVRLFAANETIIYFLAPPFVTVAEEASRTGGIGQFWLEFGALDQISPTHSLVLADFGIGSDAPIILDYREASNPPVLRLHWHENNPDAVRTCWVKGADNFEEFARLLGL